MPNKNQAIRDLKKRRHGDLTKQNFPRGQERKEGGFRVQAFKERLGGVGKPQLAKLLSRQQDRVTEPGRDFAQQKIALIQKRLGNAGVAATPGAPQRPGNPPAHSNANPTPGAPRRRRRKPQFQNPGRPGY